MKRPAFQFYPGDWQRDAALRSCSVPARGLLIEMICIMHDAEPYGHLRVNGKPITVPTQASEGATRDPRNSGPPWKKPRRSSETAGQMEPARMSNSPSRSPEDLLWSSLATIAAQSPPNCDTAISGAVSLWSSAHPRATVEECVAARKRICAMFGRAVG